MFTEELTATGKYTLQTALKIGAFQQKTYIREQKHPHLVNSLNDATYLAAFTVFAFKKQSSLKQHKRQVVVGFPFSTTVRHWRTELEYRRGRTERSENKEL